MKTGWLYSGPYTLTSGPTGTLLSVADLAAYLGDIDTSDPNAVTLLTRGIAPATFRTRGIELTVELEDSRPLWLPWGPARAVEVRKDGASEDLTEGTDWSLERRYKMVDFLTIEDTGTFRIRYTVGYTEVPPEVALEVSRVAASMWEGRFAENATKILVDVEDMLADHKSRNDWQ